MKPRFFLALFLMCSASVAVLFPTVKIKPGVTPRTAAAHTPRLVENYGKLPLAFEANRGQTDSQVKFISRGHGYTMFLTGSEAVLSLRKPSVVSHQPSANRPLSVVNRQLKQTPGHRLQTADALVPRLIQSPKSQTQNAPASSTQTPAPSTVRLKLVGSNTNAKVAGLDKLPGKSNYFIGNDPKKWRTNVANYAKVKYHDVYPGIDLVYYGNQGRLEHDFIVSPGANPAAIQLMFEGAEAVSIDQGGNLVATVGGGNIVLNKPTVYQPTFSNTKSAFQNPTSVDGRFVLAANQVTFELGPYDNSLPLVIDPVLVYSTYLGGGGSDYGYAMAADASGNVYVTGETTSLDFPVTPGAFQTTTAGDSSAFVTKLSADGSTQLYSTYLGGINWDRGFALAVDPSGNAYVAGITIYDFPTTPTAFQKAAAWAVDGFVTKIGPSGDALVYSAFLGGNADDYIYSLAVDSAGAAYVTGQTDSTDFPTKNALQSAFGGGSACGGGFGIQRKFRATPQLSDGGGACPDAFVTKLAADGASLVYSTYLGKTGEEYGTTIAVDPSGNAVVGGYTNSGDFPTHNPLQGALAGDYDGFVLKLNPAGSALVFSTFLGGSAREYLQTLVLDSQNNILITGGTGSSNFPTASPFQSGNAGNFDAFLTKMSSSGSSLVFSTYFGGADVDNGLVVARDASDNIYVAGVTRSSNLPLQSPIQQNSGGGADMFVVQFAATGGTPLFSTYLGGSGDDAWTGGSLAVGDIGNIYVTGDTTSTDFPTANPIQATNGGYYDAFVAKIGPQVAPGVSLSPANLNFGDQATAATSAARTATLTNTGTQPLTIDSIALSSGTDYAESHADCPIAPDTLAGGAHCSISVTFTPTALGALTDEVIVTSDAAGSPHTLDLTGNGVPPAPVAELSPPSLHFASQMVGDSFESQSVTLTNTGTAELTITSIESTTADFILDSYTCPVYPMEPLTVNASCTIVVSFKPTARGDLTGSITITDNAQDSPQIIELGGTGMIPAKVELSAASLNFGNQLVGSTSAPQIVTLTNTGDGQFMIDTIVAGGDFARTTTCPTGITVMGGASCTITVTFAPTATGTRDSTLTITHDAPTGPHTVTLTGTGTDFAVSGEDSKTVTAGGTATYNLQIAPTGYAGTVALACAWQGPQPEATRRSVTPNSVTLNGAPAAFAVSVTTTARSTAVPQGPAMPPSPASRHFLPLAVALTMLMLAAVAPPFRVTFAGLKPGATRLALAATLLFVLLWASCGGGEPPPPQQTPYTHAGTYHLTLTATASGVSKTSSLTLVVN